MELSKLLQNVDVVLPISDAKIDNICTEASELKENSLFLITGVRSHNMIPWTDDTLQAAISKHTGFILWDSENWPKHDDGIESCRYIDVIHYRKACAQICSNFYQSPSKKLLMVGVTGTNGKTSTTFLLERLLLFSKMYRPLLIGSLSTRCCSFELESSYTTPYCETIHKSLRTAIDEYNADSAIMEVSSRGLDQGRVAGIAFDVAIFTNLSQDHLSYHANFNEYKRAKAILFEDLVESFAIINRDDDYAQYFIDKTKKTVQIITYGIEQNHGTDIYASNIELSIHGLKFDITIPATNSIEHIDMPNLFGKSNVYNSLAALACAHLALHIPLELCKQILVDMPSIPGRLEFVTTPQDPITVIIDSAHTPDGFKEILSTLKTCKIRNKLICLFGCRGNTDQASRPYKGAIARELADTIILTTDTISCEDPRQIIENILSGFPSTSDDNHHVIIEINRKEAIKKAILSIAEDKDILVILGKRHAVSHMIQRQMIDFDDRTLIREYIQQRIQNHSP